MLKTLRKYGYSTAGLNCKFDSNAQVIEKKVVADPESTKPQPQKNFKEYDEAKDDDVIVTIEHWYII